MPDDTTPITRPSEPIKGFPGPASASERISHEREFSWNPTHVTRPVTNVGSIRPNWLVERITNAETLEPTHGATEPDVGNGFQLVSQQIVTTAKSLTASDPTTVPCLLLSDPKTLRVQEPVTAGKQTLTPVTLLTKRSLVNIQAVPSPSTRYTHPDPDVSVVYIETTLDSAARIDLVESEADGVAVAVFVGRGMSTRVGVGVGVRVGRGVEVAVGVGATGDGSRRRADDGVEVGIGAGVTVTVAQRLATV